MKGILQKVGVCFVILILFDAFVFPLSEALVAEDANKNGGVVSEDFLASKSGDGYSNSLENSNTAWNGKDVDGNVPRCSWGNYVNMKDNVTRLIIGLSGVIDFLGFQRLFQEFSAKFVNAVSIRSEVKAIVVELPVMYVTVFSQKLK